MNSKLTGEGDADDQFSRIILFQDQNEIGHDYFISRHLV